MGSGSGRQWRLGEQEAETQSTGRLPPSAAPGPGGGAQAHRSPGGGKQMTGMPSPDLSLCLGHSSPERTRCPTPRLSPLWPVLSGCRPFTHSPSAFLSLHLCSSWVSGLGAPSCPSAHSCPGTRFPSHRHRSSKAQIFYSSICPLPTPAKCLAHTGNHVLAGGWASGSPQGSKRRMPHSYGAANCQHLTGNPVSGQRSVKEPGWSHRQRQGLGHSCLM